MINIRGVYDGRSFRALPGEPIPAVAGEVPVNIQIAEGADESQRGDARRRANAAARLLAARDATPPWNVNLKDLVEEGRGR